MRRCIPSPHGPSAHGPCMVRRRRITTACFLDVIRAPCGRRTFRTRHGVLGGAGEGTAVPGATGLRTALKRTKSPAAPRGCRCRRDACGQCRWHSGGASSKEAAAGTAGRRGLRACVRPCARKAEGRRGPYSPIRVDHDRPRPIQRLGEAQGVDGISFTVHPGR